MQIFSTRGRAWDQGYIMWFVTKWCSAILPHFRENPEFMLCIPFTTIQPSRLLRIILINIMYVHVYSFYY